MGNKKNFNNIGINDFFSDNDDIENQKTERQEINKNKKADDFMNTIKKNEETLSRTYTFYLTDKAMDLINKAADKKKVSRSKIVEEMTMYLLGDKQ